MMLPLGRVVAQLKTGSSTGSVVSQPHTHRLSTVRPMPAGATQTQVADQASRISSAVAQMLSPGMTGTPAVVALRGGPGASDSHSGARAVAGQQAQQAQREQEASLAVQSAPVGQPASDPFLLKDGFMQFEGPTYPPSEPGLLSIQSAEDGTGSGDVQVVLAASGSDPLVLCQHASSPDR